MPRRWTDDDLRAAVADPTVTTVADVCRRLGIVPRGASYEVVRGHARRLGLTLPRRPPSRPPFLPASSDDEVVRAVAETRSIAAALRALGITPETNAARRWLTSVIDRLGLDTSHHTGQGWARGRSIPKSRLKPEQLSDGRKRSGVCIQRCLIGHGIREHRCEICERTEWNDRPIPLETDHINGDRFDNRPENLRFLCPNCHAQTPTYRGRNIGRYDPDGLDGP